MEAESEEESPEKKEELDEKWDHDKYQEIVEAEQELKRTHEQPEALQGEESVSQNSKQAQEKDKGAKKYGNFFCKQYEDATRQSVPSSGSQKNKESTLKSKNSDVPEEKMSDSAQRALEEFMNGDKDQIFNQTEQPKRKTKGFYNKVLDVEEEYNVTTFSTTRAQPVAQKPLRATARGSKTKYPNRNSANSQGAAVSNSSSAPQIVEQQAPGGGAAVDFAKLHTFYEDELEEEKQNEWETVGVDTHQSEGFSSDKKSVEQEQQNLHEGVVQEAAVEEIDEVSQGSKQEQIESAEVKKVAEPAASALKEQEVEPPATLPAAPTKMPNVTPEAQSFIATLDEALSAGNGELLSELTFDAECEGFADQIDLTWYEQQAAQLILSRQ